MNTNSDSVEYLLNALMPEDPRIDRERLMFLAGHAAGNAEVAGVTRRASWLLRAWQGATFVSLCAATMLAMSVVTRPVQQIVYIERPVLPAVVSEPAPDEPTQSESIAELVSEKVRVEPSATRYIAERERALREGIESLQPERFISLSNVPSRQKLMSDVCSEISIEQPTFKPSHSTWLDTWFSPPGDRL